LSENKIKNAKKVPQKEAQHVQFDCHGIGSLAPIHVGIVPRRIKL
jgi:hypothetical protein